MEGSVGVTPAAGPSRGPRVLSLSVAILLLGALPALGETLASANFKADVVAAVAGEAAGANFRVCAGAGCMAVPLPAVVVPANPAPAPGGGGGGGGGGPAPTPAADAPPTPVEEPASTPLPEVAAPPEPTPAEGAFLPPLPLPTRSPAPAPGLPIPWPAAAVAGATALALLVLARSGVAARVPPAGAKQQGEEVAVAPGTEVIGGNCPFCGDFIKGIGLIMPCPSCRAVHHPECWRENGGCTTLGCPRGPKRRGAAEAAE